MGDAPAHQEQRTPAHAAWTLRALVEGLARVERAANDPAITQVVDDSRRVIPGALFVARRGPNRDGAMFLTDALARGAGAILLEDDQPTPPIDPVVAILRAPDTATALAHLVERFHGDPGAALLLVGVTGTNGKTTTSTLTRHLLEASGVRCGLISTCAIDAGKGEALGKAQQTTPGAVELSQRLAMMRERGCAAAVIETSSHALEQRRVVALRTHVAVFTNLTGDHLDYHGTMERYAEAKAMLFAALPSDGFAVVNADDPWTARMVRACSARVITCTAQAGGTHDASVRVLGYTPGGMNIHLRTPFGERTLTLPLVGEHNAMNALQAACAAWCAGADAEAIFEGLTTAPAPPGRLEPVARRPGVAEPFSVFVDYAHTDDALARALRAVRPLVGPGASLRVVFGCGGDRDRTKRPRMGAVASELADELIITSDNPRTEDPGSIVAQVMDGVGQGKHVETIIDRERAILHAISSARDGDVVLIAGKGHEDYQILPDGRGGTVTRHFDDREVARAALLERFGALNTIEPKPPLAARQHGGGIP